MILKSSVEIHRQRTARTRRRLLLLAASYIRINLSLLAIGQIIMSGQTGGGARGGGTSVRSRGGTSATGSRSSKKSATKDGRVDATAEDTGVESDTQTVDKSDKADRAHWTVGEMRTLVEYLHKHKAAGEGSSFKPTTWTAAALHINNTYPNVTEKNSSQVSRKYTKGVSRQFKEYSLAQT